MINTALNYTTMMANEPAMKCYWNVLFHLDSRVNVTIQMTTKVLSCHRELAIKVQHLCTLIWSSLWKNSWQRGAVERNEELFKVTFVSTETHSEASSRTGRPLCDWKWNRESWQVYQIHVERCGGAEKGWIEVVTQCLCGSMCVWGKWLPL